MITQRVAEPIREAEFGDQFVVLQNLDLYQSDTDLEWHDLTFRQAETMIVG
jgi:hypothetical protein